MKKDSKSIIKESASMLLEDFDYNYKIKVAKEIEEEAKEFIVEKVLKLKPTDLMSAKEVAEVENITLNSVHTRITRRRTKGEYPYKSRRIGNAYAISPTSLVLVDEIFQESKKALK